MNTDLAVNKVFSVADIRWDYCHLNFAVIMLYHEFLLQSFKKSKIFAVKQ